MIRRGGILGRRLAAACLALAAAASASRFAAAQAASEGRLYGSIPVSLDPQALPPQFHFDAHHIGQDSNLLAVHMDWWGIPWDALASGAPLPRAWLAEIDRADALARSLGLPVYLAVTPISGTRDRIAPRASGDGDLLVTDNAFGGRCEDMAARPDAASLRRAYHALVELLVARFQPRYLALSIEVNLYSRTCPIAWPSMRDFLNAEYDVQKAEHPALPIFHTYQVDVLWAADEGEACFGFRRECLAANVAQLADLRCDLWALSSYPVPMFLHNGRVLPDDYFSAVADLSGRPLAIAETAYLSQTYSAMAGGTCVGGLPSSPADQLWWMDRVLADAQRLHMPFVVWWIDEALMPFAELLPCRCSDSTEFCRLLTALGDEGAVGVRYFGAMALRDYDGAPTPALGQWLSAVAAAEARGVRPPAARPQPRGVAPR